jgi:hypothetical protein
VGGVIPSIRNETMRAAIGAWLLVAACGERDAGRGLADAAGEFEFETEAESEFETEAEAEFEAEFEAETEAEAEATVVQPPDRLPGARAPLTARCDAAEEARCLLPWPSNVFTVANPLTPTGLTVHVEADILRADEGLALLNEADGFSRLTPLVALVPLGVDPSAVTLRLFVAEPGADFASEVPLRVSLFPGRDEADPAALVATPLAPLAPATEHLAIVTGLAPNRVTHLATLRASAADDAEAARVAYHAPHRAIVATRGVDTDTIGRLWDFTTRSAADPRNRLQSQAAAAKAAVDDGRVTLVVDSAIVPLAESASPAAVIVRGHLDDIPDPAALPGTPEGESFSVPFRVVVPVAPPSRPAPADYRVVLYGHGTGGSADDAAFDALIAGAGAAKVNIEVDGWTDATVGAAISGLLLPLTGTDALVARMRRAQAGIAAIQRALVGPLGDALAADTLAGIPNPAAGRRPLVVTDRQGHRELELPVWAGGSLGGVTGMVYGHLEPSIVGGVLNVPGAGFTHWLSQSGVFSLIAVAFAERYPAIVDLQVATAMTQALWDEVDGAAWADARGTPPLFLVQMSVGDPIMPNVATALVATSLRAAIVGGTPVPVPGLVAETVARGKSALTEFVVPPGSAYQIHGFAAGDTPAGSAARAQIIAFIQSLWAGDPTITLPDACLALDPPGTCDFSQ